jgi:hypothetical protein
MKLGLRLPQRLGVDLQHDLVEAARTAEAAGYASLWTYEQLLFAETPVEPYAPPNVPWPESGRQTADPLAVLTAAGATRADRGRRCQQPGPRRQFQGPAARRQTCGRLAAATHNTRASRSRGTARKLGPHPADGC